MEEVCQLKGTNYWVNCNVPRRYVTQADLIIKCESYFNDISVEYMLRGAGW